MNNFEDGPFSDVFVEEMEDQDKYMAKCTAHPGCNEEKLAKENRRCFRSL